MSERQFTEAEDAFFHKRLIADYDKLIRQIEETMANGVAESFAAFFTAMDGKLVLAALRHARENATALLPTFPVPLVDPTQGKSPSDPQPTVIIEPAPVQTAERKGT